MDYEYPVGQGGHKFVTDTGRVLRGTSDTLLEGRQDQEPTAGQRFGIFLRQSPGYQSPGQTSDDRLFPPQKQRQAFPFHGRVKAADHCDSIVAQSAGEVIGLEDQFARALDRAEKCECLLLQKVHSTERVDTLRCMVPKIGCQSVRVARLGSSNTYDRRRGHRHKFVTSSDVSMSVHRLCPTPPSQPLVRACYNIGQTYRAPSYRAGGTRDRSIFS